MMDDWPYCNHPEPALLQATLSTQLLRDGYRNTTLQWRPRGPRRAVSLSALQQPRPASVPSELGASPVPCSDRWNVFLEPVVQSHTEMLQLSALKICLMQRYIGRQHTPSSRARALAGADLPPIERWKRGRGQSRGEGMNRLRCRSVSFAHGNALCIAKEL